jgi:large subunit ribosomal protein L24
MPGAPLVGNDTCSRPDQLGKFGAFSQRDLDESPCLADTYALLGGKIKMQKIRKGDLVQVVSGAGAAKATQGRVIAVDVARGRVRVEGVRLQKRHLRPGRSGAREGGIVESEGYVDASNVMLVHPTDNKPSRVRVEERDGERVRVFARGGELVPDPAGI